MKKVFRMPVLFNAWNLSSDRVWSHPSNTRANNRLRRSRVASAFLPGIFYYHQSTHCKTLFFYAIARANNATTTTTRPAAFDCVSFVQAKLSDRRRRLFHPPEPRTTIRLHFLGLPLSRFFGVRFGGTFAKKSVRLSVFVS